MRRSSNSLLAGLVTVALILPSAVVAYPWLWVDDTDFCTEHPNEREDRHKIALWDSSATFIMTANDSSTVQQVCPGATYRLKVRFPNQDAQAYITSSTGAWGKPYVVGNCVDNVNSNGRLQPCPLPNTRCPNQAAFAMGNQTVYEDTLVIACTSSGTETVKMTWASGETDRFKKIRVSFPVNKACTVPACKFKPPPRPPPPPKPPSPPRRRDYDDDDNDDDYDYDDRNDRDKRRMI